MSGLVPTARCTTQGPCTSWGWTGKQITLTEKLIVKLHSLISRARVARKLTRATCGMSLKREFRKSSSPWTKRPNKEFCFGRKRIDEVRMFFLFAAEKKQRWERLLKAKEDENPTDVPRRVDPSTRSRTRSNNALSPAPGCSPQKQRARARDENRTVLLRNVLIFLGGEGWGMKRWGSKVKGQFLSLSFRGDKWPAAEVKKKKH